MCEISCKNSERLLRKWQKKFRGYCFCRTLYMSFRLIQYDRIRRCCTGTTWAIWRQRAGVRRALQCSTAPSWTAPLTRGICRTNINSPYLVSRHETRYSVVSSLGQFFWRFFMLIGFVFTGRQHVCYAEPCTSYGRDVCLSVCLTYVSTV